MVLICEEPSGGTDVSDAVPALVSRADAKALGLNRYFTGKPCKWGHVCERTTNAQCLTCNKTRNKTRSGLYRAEHKEQALAWRQKNTKKVKDYGDFYRSNPIRMIMSYARHRAMTQGIEFSLKDEDIKIPEVCPILGIPLFKTPGKVGNNTPSLDRIHVNKGYIKGNVCVISYEANRRKSDWTIDMFRSLVAYMESGVAEHE
jgi:hypothetical protein